MSDKPDLPLSAIRAIVADAEAEILQVLERVRERAGVAVADIDLETVTQWRVGDPRSTVIPSRVKLEIEEI